MSKLYVMGDILRPKYRDKLPKSSIQNEKIIWLANLLRLSGLRIYDENIITWGGGFHEFPVHEIYKNHSFVAETKYWVELYNSDPNRADIEIFASIFDEGDIVFGFELPPFIQKTLSMANIKFVSLSIAPERFASDYFWQFESNIDVFLKNVEIMSFSDEQLYAAAYMRQRSATKLNYSFGPVIFGQIVADASLLYRKKILSMRDFHQQLDLIATNNNIVYFKRHPFAGGDEDIIDIMVGSYGFIPLNEKPYDILSSSCFGDIYSITSSIIKEAKYFKKSAFYLSQMKGLRGLFIEREPIGRIFGHKMMSREFWLDAFRDTDYSNLIRKNYSDTASYCTLKELLSDSWEHSRPEIAEWNLHIPVELNAPIEFREEAKPWGSDWITEQGFGTWSKSRINKLRMRINAKSVSPIQISLTDYEIFLGNEEPRKMTIFINGEFYKTYFFNSRIPMNPINIQISKNNLKRERDTL